MVLTNLHYLVLWTALFALLTLTFAKQTRIYSNEFAVHIPDGNDAAEEIASKYGFINKGQVRNIVCMLLLMHNLTILYL